MTKYIYNHQGSAVALFKGTYIYSMQGNPVGQIVKETHVHRLTGRYVGELYKDMVVDRHMGTFGNVRNPGNPGNAGSPGDPGNRGSLNYAFPDVPKKLLSS